MGELLRPFGDEPIRERGEERPLYRPNIQFPEYGGLLVSFDHALEAQAEEVDGAETVTTFVVDPRRDLYAGLQFIPRRTLEEVARGLETYLEDETLEDERKALITHGVSRLNKFFATGSLEAK